MVRNQSWLKLVHKEVLMSNIFPKTAIAFSCAVFSLTMFANSTKAVTLSDAEIAIKIAQQLGSFFGGNNFEPDVGFTSNACSINVGITNLRGVFGNGDFSETYTSSFWEFSLTIDADEGFTKRDRLQVGGQIQHLNDRCDLDRDNDKGSPLSYKLFLDLNNLNTRNKIDENSQIFISDSTVPKEAKHPVGNINHTDILTQADLSANIFNEESEIGQFDITLAAKHEGRKPQPVPEPATILGSIISLGFGILFKRINPKN